MWKTSLQILLTLSTLSFTLAQLENQTTTPFFTSQNTLFGNLIEGTSVDELGNIFATNFLNETFAIGQIFPEQKEFFLSNNESSSFNGIRFLKLTKEETINIKSVFLAADKKRSEVTKVTFFQNNSVEQTTFCKDASFIEPNDLAISYNSGRIYISGQNFTNTTQKGDGGLWLCEPDGQAKQLLSLGRTNGIELSPDEKVLYLSEAFNQNFIPISNKIWKFSVDVNNGQVSNQELFIDFAQLDSSQFADIDGMRCDVEGNLWVARNGDSKVLKFSADKKLLLELNTEQIIKTANLEFGGKNGSTLFIVGKCKDDNSKGCVDIFENSVPGRAFSVLTRA
ncbi:5908_t:CDS:2 [Gigaspora margarita]|uniref:5908_t:CDS:1 n=1 Tax=Gigaspora margarita TaxID=4874 RepID=A0ABN7UA58_GIGMA|nr:5908_t:CDS:2 [Gigaspora margarita]